MAGVRPCEPDLALQTSAFDAGKRPVVVLTATPQQRVPRDLPILSRR